MTVEWKKLGNGSYEWDLGGGWTGHLYKYNDRSGTSRRWRWTITWPRRLWTVTGDGHVTRDDARRTAEEAQRVLLCSNVRHGISSSSGRGR